MNQRVNRPITRRSRGRLPRIIGALALLSWVLPLAACSNAVAAADLVAVPDGHEADVRFFEADGRQLDGMAAFRRMANADLSVWAAGNQFFAMTKVIGAFQALHPGASVGLMTLPPGMILAAIKAHGWTFGDARLSMHPDVFATVSLAQLRDTGEVTSYIVYLHNALELMVAKGNPKHVVDLHDLTRTDLRVMLPNPLAEGIMAFYGKPILQRLGLWTVLSPGADCKDCDTAGHVHFATVHHREIPTAIAAGQADVGLVWRTEVLAAIAAGAPVEGVPLPPEQNAADQVTYVAGALEDSPHAAMAAAYIGYLGSQAGQDAYAAYGFLPADRDERTPRPLPSN
jgi:ABC-type molybdate transport system substrate-binding protein